MPNSATAIAAAFFSALRTATYPSALPALIACLLGFLAAPADAKPQTLESPHYRVHYEKKYRQLAGEILEVAEAVWPTLAKAYESYDRYERIDIRIIDEGDDANGFAIYTSSSVAIFPTHMDWVMRNRQAWIRNVVTHELAHVFSLRRAAWLSPVDAAFLYGSTYNYTDKINYSFQLPWVPLVAPTWYVEGIAQFEAFMNGNDSWDSQRDMVVRDAYLTGTLPSLDFIETFEPDEDWTQAERCYNTGYAFLLYLKDRFGAEKVRKLAFSKPLFNFSWSVGRVFGKGLPDLFEDFKRSLGDRYAFYKDLPPDSLADRDMEGGFQQNLAFSPDGRYMAWLGNDEERRYPLNWIYWKPLDGGLRKSARPVYVPPPAPAAPAPAPAPAPVPDPVPPTEPGPEGSGILPNAGVASGPGLMPPMRTANPALALMKRASSPRTFASPLRTAVRRAHPAGNDAFLAARRSEEFGAAGLEFSPDGSRLLTARQDRDARHVDLWEYAYRSRLSESGKWRRLTWEERAAYPSYHPTRNLIVYSRKENGSSNLALLDSTGRTRQLTRFSDGEQVYNPRFNPAGDSIYFTLGVDDREAVFAIDAGAPAFDPFLAARDSALFPDSLSMARGQALSQVLDWRQGGIRDLRFSGDTLFFASNAEDTAQSIYDIYARLPGDSALYRATRVPGQALEPLVRDGELYYQGFRRQQFRIFRRQLALIPTGRILAPPRDTVPAPEPKKIEYDKIFPEGEGGGAGIVSDIQPYLALTPVFLSGTKSYTDLELGLDMAFGPAFGGIYQAVTGAVTKRTRFDSPLNYKFIYQGSIGGSAIRHNRYEWTPSLYYSVYHDVIGANDLQARRGPSADFPGADVSLRTRLYTEWSRWAVAAAAPLPAAFRIFGEPYQMNLGGSYFQQFIDEDFSQRVEWVDRNDGSLLDWLDIPRTPYLRDASEHRHYEADLQWGWSKGKPGTFLPNGGGLYALVRRYWATYIKYDADLLPIDSAAFVDISRGNGVAPQYVPVQDHFDPWALEGGLGGVYSFGRHLSLFANVEAGMFLNTIPTYADIGHADGPDTIVVRRPQPYLWPIMYRLGYYRLSGYPYNFNYRGRDIMEGPAYGFAQAGAQVPLKAGAFLPGLPTTSLKQFMITALAECGTTLLSSPDAAGDSLWQQQYHLLVDVGLRLSANFKLYHQFPFTFYVQGFLPINDLKAENLYNSDYPTSAARPGEGAAARDLRDRKDYIDIVKQPRYYVGFNLGLF